MQPTSIGDRERSRSSSVDVAACCSTGRESQCGWLKDKYGLSWQIVPKALPRLLQQTDPNKAQRVVQALLQMKKLDIGALERAAQGA